MGRIVSIHEYRPRTSASRRTCSNCSTLIPGLRLQLPGLVAHHFVKGAKGVRRGAYAALWIYESREAWEHLWGTAEHPRPPQEYPDTWKVWEQDILAPFLVNHPDAIRFTAYEELKGFDTV